MTDKVKKYCEGLDCAICDEKEPCIYKIANELQEQLKRKEQECEELKEYFKIAKEASNCNLKALGEMTEWADKLDEENDQLKAENKELKEELEELKEENEYNEANAIEFKQTLTEIKKIAEKIDDSDGCAYGDYDCDNCSSLEQEIVCTYKVKKLILQKISEVEDGGN